MWCCLLVAAFSMLRLTLRFTVRSFYDLCLVWLSVRPLVRVLVGRRANEGIGVVHTLFQLCMGLVVVRTNCVRVQVSETALARELLGRVFGSATDSMVIACKRWRNYSKSINTYGIICLNKQMNQCVVVVASSIDDR